MSNFKYEDWLEHFNPNHDPNNGQFSKKSGFFSSLKKAKAEKKAIQKEVSKKTAEIYDKANDEASEYIRKNKLNEDDFVDAVGIDFDKFKTVDSWIEYLDKTIYKEHPEYKDELIDDKHLYEYDKIWAQADRAADRAYEEGKKRIQKLRIDWALEHPVGKWFFSI